MFYLGITFANKVQHGQYLGKSETKPSTHFVYCHTFLEKIALDGRLTHPIVVNNADLIQV
jgi:hypothetical protein